MRGPLFDLVIEEAVSPLGDEWAELTFPTYRHLLGRLGMGDADRRRSQPIAWRARRGAQPAGLALAEISSTDRSSAELLSIYVIADLRGRGLGTMLLTGLEDDLSRRGVRQVSGVYTTGKPVIPALERVFAKRDFTTPEKRTIVVRFTPEEAARTPWYARARLPSGSAIFPWTELTAEEREALKRSQVERGWIHPDLEPWRSDTRFDTVSSVGLRMRGDVVGWVINHRVRPNLVSFTTSFVRNDLARRGGIFPLYVASLERLKGTGVTCTLVTATRFEAMNRFILRRCAPFVSFCGETRGVSKTLSGTAAIAEVRR